MKESVKFSLVLDDDMSPGLLSIGKNGQQAFDKIDDEVDNLNRGLAKTNKGVTGLNGGLSGLRGTAMKLGGLLAGVFAANQLFSFGSASVQTAADVSRLETAITTASGSAEEAQKNLSFLDITSNKLGLNLRASQSGFKTLSGAMKGTALEGDPTREIFEGVATAAAAMGLDAETSEGAFLALGQMMSKGRVSAEELNGQLGERIPGALGYAAKAMGTTTEGLMDMMQKGELMSKDFLPKFAAELKNTFQDQANKNADSFAGQMILMENAMYKFKTTAGKALAPLMTSFWNLSTTIMQYLTPAIDWLGQTFRDLKNPASELRGWIDAIGVGLAATSPLVLAYGGYIAYTSGILSIASIKTGLLTASQWLLNAAFWANPITWVVGGLMAFVAGIALAYQKSESFRIALWTLWEGAKAVFNNIRSLATDVFGGLGDLWDNMFDSEGRKKALNRINNAFKNFKEQVVSDTFRGVIENKNSFDSKGATKGLLDVALPGAPGGKNNPPFGVDPSAPAGINNKLNASVAGSGRVSGSGSSRPLTIHIGKLFEDQIIQVQGDLKDNYNQIREAVNKALTDSIRDFELSYE